MLIVADGAIVKKHESPDVENALDHRLQLVSDAIAD